MHNGNHITHEPADWTHPVDAIEPVCEVTSQSAIAMTQLTIWMLESKTIQGQAARLHLLSMALGLSFIVSFQQVATMTGLTRSAVSKDAREFSERFGLKIIQQRKQETKDKCRKSQNQLVRSKSLDQRKT